MTLNFYTLGVIYLVYSFLGWVAETVVATIRGGRFANRGAAAGPFRAEILSLCDVAGSPGFSEKTKIQSVALFSDTS